MRVIQRTCNTKVHHLHRAGVGDHDVRRLNITVNNPGIMRRLQRLTGGDQDPCCIRRAECAFLAHNVTQRAAMHQFHDNKWHRSATNINLSGVVHLHNRRVIQPTRILGFASETFLELYIPS